MPPVTPAFISALLLLGACSPSRFSWPSAPGAQLRGYRASFAAAAGDELVERVTRGELRQRARAAGTLWLGDHHRHSRLHALQTRLLQELVEDGAQLALGLEAVGTRDQRLVDGYLAGERDMRSLRAQMKRRWPGSWLDDPELDPWFFRSLLAFAKEHEVPVFALEPTPRLRLAARDACIAQSVREARARHPRRLVVVVVGQTHLLGDGDVVRRSGCGGVVVGGRPTEQLANAARPAPADGGAWRSDCGVYWFDQMFDAAGGISSSLR